MSTLMCFIPMVAQKRHNLDYDNSRIQVKIFFKCLYVIVPMNPLQITGVNTLFTFKKYIYGAIDLELDYLLFFYNTM